MLTVLTALTVRRVAFTRFVYRPRWFVLAQTEGEALPEPVVPAWDAERALATLGVAEVEPSRPVDGNVMGYARDRAIALNPLNPLPHKTRFHELAHVLLGHTAEGRQSDGEVTPRNLRECEAESVALLCCAASGPAWTRRMSRGYIQHWWGQGNEIPERSAQAVLRTADAILKAGAPGAGGGVPMTLTDQERATLRAALHCWQNELGCYTTEELREYYPDLRDAEPLTIDEVERLLARLERAGWPPPRRWRSHCQHRQTVSRPQRQVGARRG